MTGIGIQMSQKEILKYLRDPSGIAELLLEVDEETGDSPAEVFADLINVMRADTARIAAAHDVDVDVELMTPERAAELLAGTLDGQGVELVKCFNAEAERRDKILRELLDEEEHEQFMALKHQRMNTHDDESDE
jgi:hypothetical protein